MSRILKTRALADNFFYKKNIIAMSRILKTRALAEFKQI